MEMKEELSGKPEPQLSDVKIQSKSHEQLLNVIDYLRSQGLSHHVSLPQLIVCGDQSSGKSSVLEAVSGIRFPSADETCTRFATELILRRSSSSLTSISIIPDVKRPDDEQQKLRGYKTDLSITEDFATIIEEAKKIMGIGESGRNGKAIGKDRLRIEVSGPTQPHLTLVDLPGLIHATGPNLSENDVDAVKSLVIEYMENPRSIILAVITAKNDFNNQAVTAYAKQYDPKLKRTLGIITKPDDLPDDSARQRSFRTLVENKSEHLNLGWHILKNREYGQESFTNAERDQSETNFFNGPAWKSLNPNLKGVGQLRPRLSKVLQAQIQAELPSLLQDVQNEIKDCESILGKLGSPRTTKDEQRTYLYSVSQHFTKLIKCAVDGYYEEEYFADATTEQGYSRRIRAVVANLLEEFSEEMRLKGHKVEVVANDEVDDLAELAKAPVEDTGEAYTDYRSRNDQRFESSSRKLPREPQYQTKNDRLRRIEELIKRNRGRELPCFMKPEIITQLFREQCTPWEEFARHYAEVIFEDTRNAVYTALEAAADPTTQDSVLQNIINPGLELIKFNVVHRVEEILKQHLHGNPVTYNHYLTDNIQKRRQQNHVELLTEKVGQYFGTDPSAKNSKKYVAEHVSVDTKNLVYSLAVSIEANMQKFACYEALGYMEAYYKVALKFFVDDFGIHVIEECLMAKLPTIFDTATVLKLSDEAIEDMVGETEESREERASCSKKLATLREALSTLRRYDRNSHMTTKVTVPRVN